MRNKNIKYMEQILNERETYPSTDITTKWTKIWHPLKNHDYKCKKNTRKLENK